MKLILTGSSRGIGRAIAERFLSAGYTVEGLDILPSEIRNPQYIHHICDVSTAFLPEIVGAEILINCAGEQNGGRDLEVNLKGAMRVTEKYAFTGGVKSVLFIASASASTGSEFPEYVASKGGLISYMKNVALRLAPLGGTANSLSPGGVLTESNARVIRDPAKWREIMDETPLKKWASPEEIAEWAYFIAAVNSSMTAQDVIVDNGESARAKFVW